MLKQYIEFAKKQKNDGFVSYEWSDRVIVRGKQTFAVFGNVAYDVSKMKFTFDNTCVPGTGKLCVSIKGRYLAQFPDEGQSGIMGSYVLNRNGKNKVCGPTFVSCGWLHTEELGLTNAEITQNILEDVARGENVFTNKPAGWL
jgi:hypothetical protein